MRTWSHSRTVAWLCLFGAALTWAVGAGIWGWSGSVDRIAERMDRQQGVADLHAKQLRDVRMHLKTLQFDASQAGQDIADLERRETARTTAPPSDGTATRINLVDGTGMTMAYDVTTTSLHTDPDACRSHGAHDQTWSCGHPWKEPADSAPPGQAIRHWIETAGSVMTVDDAGRMTVR